MVYNDSNQWKPVSGKIMVYFEKTQQASDLTPGTRILFKGNYFSIKNSGNPGSLIIKIILPDAESITKYILKKKTGKLLDNQKISV
jgi:hypothetical protein